MKTKIRFTGLNKEVRFSYSTIDAVITRVDGDDPLHQEKLNTCLYSIGYKP